MMCSILESAAFNIRETDDLLNPVGAGCLTGVIYKITSVRRTHAPQRLGLRLQPFRIPNPKVLGHPPLCSRVLHSQRACFASQGPRVALSAGLGLGAVAAAGAFMTKQISSRGLLKNFL